MVDLPVKRRRVRDKEEREVAATLTGGWEGAVLLEGRLPFSLVRTGKEQVTFKMSLSLEPFNNLLQCQPCRKKISVL